jgi:tubulin polyglutamylase complex subunit 2
VQVYTSNFVIPFAMASSSSPGIREIFDDISLSVISFLENHDGVTSVDFVERRGAALSEIVTWEQEHKPYLLPNDYKAFLLISNGLLLRWHIHHHENEFPLGCLHLNELSRVDRIERNDEDSDEEYEEGLNAAANGEEAEKNKTSGILVKRGPKGRRTLERLPKNSAAFDLDHTCTGGHVTLFYRDNTSNPQIWFQDMSCKWFFIANSFTDYFRLMIMHLGLPCWQYAFTEVGLDPVSQQWFRFLSPERLAIDIDNCKMKEMQRLRSFSSGISNSTASSIGIMNGPKSTISANSKNTSVTRSRSSNTTGTRERLARRSSYSSAGRDRLKRPSSAPMKRRGAGRENASTQRGSRLYQ